VDILESGREGSGPTDTLESGRGRGLVDSLESKWLEKEDWKVRALIGD